MMGGHPVGIWGRRLVVLHQRQFGRQLGEARLDKGFLKIAHGEGPVLDK